MDNNLINNFNRQSEEEFNIRDFLFLCLAKWRWFALSLLICLSIAVYKVSTTHPTYSRYTDILIKSGQQGNMSEQMEKFASMGAFRGNTTVYNEIYALQSPSNIYEVVNRLNLDMNYERKGLFYNKVLYGSELPFKATIVGIPDNAFASFKVTLQPDGNYTITEFNYAYGAEEYEIDPKIEKKGRLTTFKSNTVGGDTIDTPFGRQIVITTTPYYKEGGEEQVIYVTRRGLYGTANSYAAKLSFNLKDKDADIITVSMVDRSTKRAEDVLRTVIEVYNERWIADKNQLAEHTSIFINDRLEDIALELENVDSIISTYKSQNLLPDIHSTTSMYMSQNQKISSQIIDLNNELAISNFILDYLADNKTKNQILPSLQLKNSGVSSQIDKYNLAILQRNNLVSNSSENNPLVIELDDYLNSVRDGIISSVSNLTNTLKTQINTLEQERENTKELLAKNPAQSKFLTAEGRNQTVKEQLYLFLLQKREENELSKAFTAYNTRVVTPPTGGLASIGPNKKKTYMLAFAIALVIPVALLIAREFLDTKIRSRKDLEGIDISIIGEIPLAYRRKRQLPWRKQSEKLKVVVKNGSRNIINEAFRVMRTNIDFMVKDNNQNVIIITSFNPGSGKSFITMNLGASMALKGKRVLLIDGDMRHASLSTFVSAPKLGLSNYLAGLEENIENCKIKSEVFPGLEIIPVGTIPPNPTELLENPRFQNLVESSRTKYDYVIIDCPPIDIVADTSIIEKSADRTMFVVRSGLLERSMVPEIDNLVKEERFKSISLIINGIEDKGGRYSGRYGYRYGHRYGYSYGYGYGYSHGYGYYSDEEADNSDSTKL